jgi:hypothetical protein
LGPATNPTLLDPDADPTHNPLGSSPDPTPNSLRSDHGPNPQPSTLNYNKNNIIIICIIILNIHIKNSIICVINIIIFIIINIINKKINKFEKQITINIKKY